MSTPDYVLKEDFSHWVNGKDQVLLKAGTFVRPVEFKYLPKEMQKEAGNEFIALAGQMSFCYTCVGIIPIPKELLRRV